MLEPTDYSGLAIMAIVAGCLGTFGLLIDKFLLPNERTTLVDRLTKWWVAIDDIRIPTIVPTVAAKLIRFEQLVFGERVISLRFIATTLLLSAATTFACMVIGDYVWAGYWDRGWTYTLENPRFPLFLLNYALDFATLAITIFALRLVVTLPRVVRIPILLVDFLFALAFAFAVYTLSHAIEFWGDGVSSLEPTGIQYNYLKIDVQGYFSYWSYFGTFSWESATIEWLKSVTDGWFGPHPVIATENRTFGNLSAFLTGNTTFIPTAIVVLGLIAITVSLITLRVIQWTALRVLSVQIETETSVFFLFGSTIGFLGVAAKGIVELSKLM